MPRPLLTLVALSFVAGCGKPSLQAQQSVATTAAEGGRPPVPRQDVKKAVEGKAPGEVNPAAGQPLAPFDPATDAARFPKLFEAYGVRPDRAAEFVPGGAVLRVGPRQDRGHVGVHCLRPGLAGDFQIEVSFAIEALPTHTTEGDGAMFGLVATIDGTYGGASVNRGASDRGPRYQAALAIPRAKGMHYAVRSYPAKTRTGRLGLRRVGAELVALAADDPGADLRELTRYPFPARPLTAVSLYADSGGAAVAMAARFSDLRVRVGPDLPPPPPPAGLTGYEVNPLPLEYERRAAAAAGDPPGGDPAGPEAGGPPAATVRGGYVWVGLVVLMGGLVAGAAIGRRWRAGPRG